MQGYVDAAIQADNRIKKLKQQKDAAEEDAAKSKKKVADTINDIKHSFLGHIAMAEAEVRGS
jgi:RPA family protein